MSVALLIAAVAVASGMLSLGAAVGAIVVLGSAVALLQAYSETSTRSVCLARSFMTGDPVANKFTPKGKAAVDMVRSLDKSLLTTMGWGLEHYWPSRKRLPGEEPFAEPGDPLQRPTLITTPDELSAGMMAVHFLWHQGIRGSTGRDPMHRDWNDAKRACEKAGLWGVVAKTRAIMHVKQAPWSQGDFFKQEQEALELFIDTVKAHDDFFLCFAEFMAFDKDLPVDTDPELLYSELLNSKTFTNSGHGVPNDNERLAVRRRCNSCRVALACGRGRWPHSES